MSNKKLLYTFITAAAFATFSCTRDEELHKPISSSTAIPAQVTGIKVENLPGKAVVSYVLPKDSNLMYVKATYKLANGNEASTKASYYSTSLTVEGFADTLEHEVKLYSVSRSEVMSEPLTIKIRPQEAPIWKVYKSINILTAFGGYNMSAVNETKADINILVLKKNAFNEYETDIDKSVYTSTDSITSKVRGLDTINYTYGFVVKDKWGNITDTLYHTFKPLYETEFSPSKFATFNLPGDAPQVTNGAALQYIWDGKLGWPYTSFTNQVPGGQGPHTITFDLGTTGKVSRVWIRPYPEGSRYYYLTTMKRFEIYGSVAPSLSGALDDSWVLLGSYTVVKPSGLPYGTDNSEDQATAAAGFNWDADLLAPKIRYMRVRCLENFAGGTSQSINELKVYGDPR
ncbi:DUF4959 domain-containing protein [Chitinophaga tropicalis]|uniref:DUF4959 domain-containing protein n=1 Tax=Chitinophaga tropicalis TaxID=2683588 RepID=A0A7K1U5Y3_9BACT|nr:DUF4959 domain-containing protein [Chitinophaga tropicalis]MVT09365.1 DUF4959 domain-containing protein [Chitinophaga tropicalis]